MWQNSKTQNVKRKKLKAENVTKLQKKMWLNSKFYKTQKLRKWKKEEKMWQN